VCDGSTEFCLGCDHGTNLDVHCLERSFETVFGEFSQAFDHGCTGATLLIGCDSADDCGNDGECVFTGGEAGFADCREPNEFSLGVACENDQVCSGDAPTCGPYDPFDYFGPYQEVLGWLPQACTSPA
jgi:hypothetical protein